MGSGIFLPPAMLAPLFVYAMVASITPGPNNIMLATSGVNFGLRRTVPHMAGINLGVLLINIAAGLGLGAVFSHDLVVRQLLQICGVAYTLWLAWKIATAGSLGGGALPHPLRFSAAFAFQWINPKVWVTTVAIVALYVRPGHTLADTAVVTAVLVVLNVPAMLIWAGFGVGLREALQVPGRVRTFNVVMGLLLAASVLAVLRGAFAHAG